jgi:hypothetical protein
MNQPKVCHRKMRANVGAFRNRDPARPRIGMSSLRFGRRGSVKRDGKIERGLVRNLQNFYSNFAQNLWNDYFANAKG